MKGTPFTSSPLVGAIGSKCITVTFREKDNVFRQKNSWVKFGLQRVNFVRGEKSSDCKICGWTHFVVQPKYPASKRCIFHGSALWDNSVSSYVEVNFFFSSEVFLCSYDVICWWRPLDVESAGKNYENKNDSFKLLKIGYANNFNGRRTYYGIKNNISLDLMFQSSFHTLSMYLCCLSRLGSITPNVIALWNVCSEV